MSLNHISMSQALGVWSELEAAYYGKNGFGRDTAEIYAYRLQEFCPTAAYASGSPSSSIGVEAQREAATRAGRALHELIRLFQAHHNCRVVVMDYREDGNGEHPDILLEGFDHRVSIKVMRDEKPLEMKS
jgi:hypothetical protein